MTERERILTGIEVLHTMMRSCESCRQAPWQHFIHDTFVCDGCAAVAA